MGIRTTFTCFQHLRTRNRDFLHETGNSLDFDYLESRQKRWYTYMHTYIQTYIHPNLWNKAGIDAGDPGWSRTWPKLVCCEVWWLRSNKMYSLPWACSCLFHQSILEWSVSMAFFAFSSRSRVDYFFNWFPLIIQLTIYWLRIAWNVNQVFMLIQGMDRLALNSWYL